MMEEDDDEVFISAVDEYPLDMVAARTNSYTRLLAAVACLDDESLRKEGEAMLAAVRKSFKTHPTGELVSIEGGKAKG
jgi:hypothetical protein